MRKLFPRLAAILATLCVLGSGGAMAQQRVGVNTAVNPQAIGAPPGGAARPLVIGQDVLFNEHIATTDKGQTQLLFVDESSMTVGPNSDLTIDQFVYDPKTGTGKLAMSATRGLLRYVGGKLSKQDRAVTLRTSTATLAVRGGAFIVDITANGQTAVIFIYGNGLTIAGLNGAVQSITQPGFEVTITPAGAMSAPQPASVALLTQLNTSLDGQPGGNGGATTIPTNTTVTQGTASLTQTLTQSLQNVVNTLVNPPTNTTTSSQSSSIQQSSSAAEVIDCTSTNSCTTGTTTVGTTSNGQPVNGTPPTTTTSAVTNNYGGQVTGTGSPATGFSTLTPPASAGNPNGTVPYATGSLTYPVGSPQDGVFSGTFGNFGSISFPLPLCSTSSGGCSTSFSSGASSAFGAFSGTTYMSADDGFFYATITPASSPGEQLFIFGGAPVAQSFYNQTGSTRIFAFTVQPDAALQSNIPFIRSQAGGNLPAANVSPFYIVAPPTTPIGDTSTLAAARGLQASLAISGQGANQQSAIEVTTGTISSQSNGQPVFNGAMRGSSLLSSSGTPLQMSGTVSSTVDSNGVSFYGGSGISGIVLSQSPSGAVETPLSGTPTSYGFAQPAIPAAVPAGVGNSRTTQALSGSFGGLMYTTAQSTPYIVTGSALISTDAENNRIQATLGGSAQTASGGASSMTLQYGGLTGANNNQAFVDDNNFAAAESTTNPSQLTVNGASGQPAAQLYLVSSGAAGQPTSLLANQTYPTDTGLPAAGQPVGYCQCQYLQWGYWGGSLTTSPTAANGLSSPQIDAANINTWVAGSVTPLADLQTLETQSATASYTGAAIGSVFNGATNSSYMAAGGFQGTYNFGTQTGSVLLSNFDGHTVGGSGSAPLSGANYSFNFGGTASGYTGTINGTFYGPKAAETGGNFAFHSVAGPTYLASGVFAGKQ
jgi:trimeric autotransporter adhesin